MINFTDFTEASYKAFIHLAKQNYTFLSYPEYRTDQTPVILWRHDIDFSLHRSLALARIEYKAGVKTTFFIYLHSSFYNALESEAKDLILQIIDLDCDIGLHFDPNFYSGLTGDTDRFMKMLKMEKEILEYLMGGSVRAFSYHNPDLGGNWLEFNDDEMAGMVNAYGRYIRGQYAYCSDSNGYWRFQSLPEVLKTATAKRLQVLTHPGWWPPHLMSPRERVSRCIDGRVAGQHRQYDSRMAHQDRLNVR